MKKFIIKTLRSSEKYTNTDMIYLSKNISWVSISNGLSSLASLALVYVFGNYISQNDYGIYQYVLSTIGILSVTTLPGINTALTKAVAEGSEKTILRGLQMKIRYGLFAGIGSLGFGVYYLLQENIILASAFLIAAIFIPFMDSFTVFNSYLEGKKDFKKSAWYSLSISIVRTATLVLIILSTKNILFIIVGYIVITTILRGICTLIILKKINKKSKEDLELVSYGKHLSLMRAISSGVSSIDNILLFQFIGSVELAIYSFAKTPITKITGALTPIGTLAYPKFSNTDISTIQKTLPKKLFLLFIGMVGITILYILLAPTLFELVLPLYTDSVFYSQIFALSLLFIPQKIVGIALTAHKQKKALYMLSIVNPIIRIVTLIILLPLMGILGIIISYLIGLFVNFFMSFYYFFNMKNEQQ